MINTNFPLSNQDDHKAFRRQMEDKRIIIENTLQSGRQYVARDQNGSDASDTDGEYSTSPYPENRPTHL